MKITDLYIRTQDDLETAVKELGILPFFVNSVRGFSIDEHVDPGIWFTGDDGYDFDARFDDGLVPHADNVLYNLIDANAPVLSK